METPSRTVRRSALLAMSVGVFCIQLDAFALNLALPEIGRDLGVEGAGLQWVISAYLLSTGTLMLGAGRLGDLFGRRRLLVWGLVLLGVSSLVCALAPNLPTLIGARVAQGAGAAMIMPVGLSLLTNVYPPELRGRATGRALGIGGIATACGPFIGGALTDAVSWRAVFWLNIPLAALGAVWASRTAESYDTATHRRVDWTGLFTATAALAALAFAIDRGQYGQWSTALAGLALVAGLLIWFIHQERVTSSPLVELTLFRNGPYVALTLAGAVVNTATVMLLFVVPLTLQGRWELPVVTAGIAFLAPALAMAVAGPLAGRVTTSGAVRVMALCLSAGAAALALLSWASSLTAYLVAAMAAGLALGTANSLTLIATQAVIRPERAGEASGVTKTVITVAAGLGVALTGAVTEQHHGAATSEAAATALQITALACLAACLILVAWTRARERRLPTPPTQAESRPRGRSAAGAEGPRLP
ncbi:MFS transporter [Streptomyces clavuligerus]|uniref:Major facilitator superfamily transporter n=1 Tax=Streptomyces clavuligerus TaxID=1901 RepID=B5GMD5_STRCL|nr:MFS transporter [Streptomyces clavuligerus]ANW22357.1 MFS transporter [Streptomyces clavuligerus]AXU17258.1 MFS transporter [Streptomyces clavuligerus]EDY47481.1 major facilitator superfamily MFS-1 [Streptomyces clavuligerus]EFG04444.1 major facilitator superfamily transporter [Streptomyces clavuligerus]MBY6307097.1 MFS transporter [Streptomyces clavuligerus]